MRRRLAHLLVLLALAAEAKSKIGRVAVLELEKNFDRILLRDVADGDGFLLLGMTRGFYLEGVGAVYSAEMNLVAGPAITPFRPTVTKDDIARLRQRKLDRLPALKKAMRQMLFDIAGKLDLMPGEEEVVVGVTLFHSHWEDTSGIPAQIVMRAQKKKLTEIPTAKRDPAQLESLVKVEEF